MYIHVYIYIRTDLFFVRQEGNHHSLQQTVGHNTNPQLDACETRTTKTERKAHWQGAKGSNSHEQIRQQSLKHQAALTSSPKHTWKQIASTRLIPCVITRFLVA